jgi:tetratricopeptide (TPR) repeat protein
MSFTTWTLKQALTAMLVLSVLLPSASIAAPLSRNQALSDLQSTSAQIRYNAVSRLASIGTMPDADLVMAKLKDEDEVVRISASAALWKIWSRSGNPAIDVQFSKGLRLMQAAKLDEAVEVFSSITKKQPQFAEAWNKRATIYFMQGKLSLSMSDCDEVLKRNRNHFGALSGYGQIQAQLGELEKAIEYFEKALAINPNLYGTAESIQKLKELLAKKQRSTI